MNALDAMINCENPLLDFRREVSCFITPEHGVISLATGVLKDDDDSVRTDGCGGAVDFDWFKIWGFLKNQTVSASKAIMIHSHPCNMLNMSPTDRNMVKGWRLGLGIPIVFLIVAYDGSFDEWCISQTNVDKNAEGKITTIGYEEHYEDYFGSEDFFFKYSLVSQVVYGMSKADTLISQDVEKIERELKEIDWAR